MHNRALRAQVLDWEARLRKRDLFVGEPGIAAFYDARLPSDVRDRPSLLAWCAARANDRALTMTAADIASREPTEITPERYPATSRSRDNRCRCATNSSPRRTTTA